MSISHLFDNDDIGEGPDEAKAVDSLLSRELLQLSINDRTALEEETHGVRCLALEETPELLQNSLQKLAMVLASDDIIPPSEKVAYMRSQHLPMTYINSDDFRLRFLRMELFDIVKAARKMVRFISISVILFGDQLLERPVCLSDFNKKELQFMRSGNLQFMPFRDRSGRRLLLMINPRTLCAEENKHFISQSREEKFRSRIAQTGKLFLYMTWVAGEDINTQRRGIVVIVWIDPSFSVISTNKMSSFADLMISPFDVASVRVAGSHACFPDTPVHRFIARVGQLRVGLSFRLKAKMHFGESVELFYTLQSFGIPTEHIPISFSGTIKTGYMKQWMRAREAQESTVYVEQPPGFRDIIECPLLTDVLFRQGISLVNNPGNARIRALIDEMQTDRGDGGGQKLIKLKRREIVLDVIEEVSKTSRFLVWNEGGWWNEIVDQEQLILKIEYLIKEVRKSKKAKRQHVNSSTYVFHDSNGTKKPRENNSDSSEDEGFSCVKAF